MDGIGPKLIKNTLDTNEWQCFWASSHPPGIELLVAKYPGS